jgi:carbon monoxide dehydrogenase subunit G
LPVCPWERVPRYEFLSDPGRAMLLKISEELHLQVAPGDAWKLLRDTPRLAGLLPGVEAVAALNEDGAEAYAAKASDRIGPFKVAMNVEVRITETTEPSRLSTSDPFLLVASLKGLDSSGANRMSGSMQIALTAESAGTLMRFEASIEILGSLATLGSVPIRRRTAQVFAEFTRNIQEQFEPGHFASEQLEKESS